MNLPSAACLLLLSAASPHAAETQPEAQAFYEKNGCPRGLTAYTIPKDHR